MSADRELLELAARAAGIPSSYWNEGAEPYSSGEGFIVKHRIWNPLRDDGDALRLAVKLRLRINREINCGWDIVEVFGPEADDMSCHCTTESVENDDPYAATRRAIVRAAAEIGRNMKCPYYEKLFV